MVPGQRSAVFQGAREAPTETRRHKHLISSGGLYKLRWSVQGSGLWVEGVLITYSTMKMLTDDKGQCLPLIWHQAISCLYPLHTVCMFAGFATHIINNAPLAPLGLEKYSPDLIHMQSIHASLVSGQVMKILKYANITNVPPTQTRK